jgi:thymidylate kinase
VIYYKFKFAKYIDELGMRDQEDGPGVHYFSISNILTILELNRTLFKDKVIVFDRSIYSAYVWSIYRRRMKKDRLMREFRKVLESDLYQDCVLFYLTRGVDIKEEKREKDYFGNFEDYEAEKKTFDEVIGSNADVVTSIKKKNLTCFFENGFNEESETAFNQKIYDCINTSRALGRDK